jgi:hypothetical protein
MKKKLLMPDHWCQHFLTEMNLDRGKEIGLLPRVQAASLCGMHQTLDKCSALTPFELPAETACIVANAVANISDTLASKISQASSSFETLPEAIAAWDT